MTNQPNWRGKTPPPPEPNCIRTDPEDGLEETPSGPMSSEWLDAVWGRCCENVPNFESAMIGCFSDDEFALLAQMQGVSAEEAASRLVGAEE